MGEKITVNGVQVYAPRQIVLDALEYVPAGRALDLGCGYGRHSLLLAAKGFTVTAVDTDEVKLASLRRRAGEAKLLIEIEQQNVLAFDPGGKTYDFVISAMVLHFLSNTSEMLKAVASMQALTAPGGVNIVCSYTDKSQEDLRPYLLNAEELQALYKDWSILEYKEYEGTDAQIDGPDKGKKIVRVELLARK